MAELSSEEGNPGHAIAAGKDHPCPYSLLSQEPCEGAALQGDRQAFDTPNYQTNLGSQIDLAEDS